MLHHTHYKMPYTIVHGDLMTADTEYIVQQNCCTAIKAHGLSKAIADKWPDINPYKDRKKIAGKRNWAIVESRPAPGTIAILSHVICAFAQYCHGKPGAYKDMELNTADSSDDRLRYFTQCLELIAELTPRPKSVGFPYKIGCGLAGGSWTKYERILKSWSDAHSDIDVKVYQL